MTEIESESSQGNNSEPLTTKVSSREALLSAAGVLFTDRGYDGVSTREIAEHAGVNLALIQYHFGSKAKLFLETVDHLTDSSADLQNKLREIPEKASRSQGAIELTYFIKDFITFLIQRSEAHSSCRLIYRELFSGNTKTNSSKDMELFDSVVKFITDRHVRPMEEKVSKLISFIVTESDKECICCLARSVIGQCSFYATHRPIIARMETSPLESDETCKRLSSGVAKFSLRGLGCDETLIQQSIRAVFGNEAI